MAPTRIAPFCPEARERSTRPRRSYSFVSSEPGDSETNTTAAERSVVMQLRYSLPHQHNCTCTSTQRISLPFRPNSPVPRPSTSANPPSPTSPDTNNKSYTLLASCMHAGSRIVRITRSEADEWSFDVLARFEEHKSMNYGSDVQPVRSGEESGKRTIVSTSFYDKLMCVWEFGGGVSAAS